MSLSRFRTAAAMNVLMLCTLNSMADTPKYDPLHIYYWNSVVCQNQVTNAVCHLWLNPDGRYVLIYDLGVQSRPLEIDGPYRIDAREGSYKLKGKADAYEVCMTPDKAPKDKVYVSEQRKELFAAAGCYPIAVHAIGDVWMQSNLAGQANKMWLLANR